MNCGRSNSEPTGSESGAPSAVSAVSPKTGGNRKKVLVVDDDRVVLKALSMRLTNGGYDVLTAADGSEAVKAAREQNPDLILLDINFPPDVSHGGGVAWDGFRIMDWLRRLDESKRTPVIMIITGSDPELYEERARAAGAIAWFQKPVEPEKLLAAMEQAIGGKGGPAASA